MEPPKRTISAQVTLDTIVVLDAVRAKLQEEHPGRAISRSDALRYCISSTAANTSLGFIAVPGDGPPTSPPASHVASDNEGDSADSEPNIGWSFSSGFGNIG